MPNKFDKSTFGWTFFIPLISSLIPMVCVIAYHNSVVATGHNFGMSNTSAYFLPYIILFLCGAVLSLLAKKIARKSLKLVVAFFLLLTPFAAGFAFHPIYEDAIYLGGTEFGYSEDALCKECKMSIIVIPDCPFCKMAIQQSGRFVSEQGNSSVEVVLCSSDSLATAKYLGMLPEGVQLRNANHPDSVAVYSGGSFPAYCTKVSDQQMRVWSNNEFGPRALDFVRSK